jgi:hypothetical protein
VCRLKRAGRRSVQHSKGSLESNVMVSEKKGRQKL